MHGALVTCVCTESGVSVRVAFCGVCATHYVVCCKWCIACLQAVTMHTATVSPCMKQHLALTRHVPMQVYCSSSCHVPVFGFPLAVAGTPSEDVSDLTGG